MQMVCYSWLAFDFWMSKVSFCMRAIEKPLSHTGTHPYYLHATPWYVVVYTTTVGSPYVFTVCTRTIGDNDMCVLGAIIDSRRGGGIGNARMHFCYWIRNTDTPTTFFGGAANLRVLQRICWFSALPFCRDSELRGLWIQHWKNIWDFWVIDAIYRKAVGKKKLCVLFPDSVLYMIGLLNTYQILLSHPCNKCNEAIKPEINSKRDLKTTFMCC